MNNEINEPFSIEDFENDAIQNLDEFAGGSLANGIVYIDGGPFLDSGPTQDTISQMDGSLEFSTQTLAVLNNSGFQDWVTVANVAKTPAPTKDKSTGDCCHGSGPTDLCGCTWHSPTQGCTNGPAF